MPGKRMPVYQINVSHSKSCVIVFTKAPMEGYVKTRLARDLGDSVAADLHRYFVNDIVDKITSAGHALKIFFDPPEADSMMRNWLGQRHDYFLQSGEDLGLKMANAFKRVFKNGIQRSVLMGTDFPDLPGEIITHAMTGLETHDAVIGPAVDGGYYLIGFRANAFSPTFFEGKSWGAGSVYHQTINALATAGISVKKLPKWRDVDVYDDLIDLIQSLTHHPEKAKLTYSFLKDIGMIKL